VGRLSAAETDPLSTDRGVKSSLAPTPGPGSGLHVLVACERSGVVRNALRALGHDAVSCDLEESQSLGPHLQCDVREVPRAGWDMIIAFPPCTYLTAAGAWRWSYTARERNEAVRLVQYLWDFPCDRLALENPSGWLNTHWRAPTQIIQPWMFGERYTKRTCLWLRGLPPLMATYVVTGQLPSWTDSHGHRPERRSRTFLGIAEAMARQWT